MTFLGVSEMGLPGRSGFLSSWASVSPHSFHGVSTRWGANIMLKVTVTVRTETDKLFEILTISREILDVQS